MNPRSHNPEHMQENMNIFDFELSTDDLANILAYIGHSIPPLV